MAEAVRNYKQLALDIIRLVGGEENIISAQRCATRLRLVLKEVPQKAHEEIGFLPGVITVVEKGGQFQVVIGPHVGEVFAVVAEELKLEERESMGQETSEAAQKQTLVNRLMQVMSGVFAPICYVLAAGGMIQGILIIISALSEEAVSTGVYQVFNLISWAPFTFLPILIAAAASRHFKCNTYIALACCLALVSPSYTELANAVADGETIRFLFIRLTETVYTSSVLPPLMLVALLASLERFLDKRLPELIKPLAIPLICLGILVPLTIVVIGPVIQLLSNLVADVYNILYAAAPPVAAAIVGGFWQVIVIFGIHWGMTPIVVANFAQTGSDSIQVFITIAVVSQMAAASGVFLKTKDQELKGISLSAAITGIFGITEPAIYGVTLPRKRPFLYGCICAGAGSVVAALFGSVNYVYAGLPGLLTTVNAMSAQNPASFIGCILGCAVSAIGTVALIQIFGYEKGESQNDEAAEPDQGAGLLVYSPLNGELKPLGEVDDPTFSGGILGKGVAILPSEGSLYAPFDGVVSAIFETKHAIGLTSPAGAELLLHVGLETVKLGGQYFDAKVSEGQCVKKGDLLLNFDLEGIKKEYDTITPVIISNTYDFAEVAEMRPYGPVSAGDMILKMKKMEG